MKGEFVKATHKGDDIEVEINASVATGMALLSIIAVALGKHAGIPAKDILTISALAVEKMEEKMEESK